MAACQAYLKRKHCCDNYKYDSRSLYADIDIEEELHLNNSNPFLRIFVLLFFTFGGFLTMSVRFSTILKQLCYDTTSYSLEYFR